MTPPLRRCVFERYHPKGDTAIFVLLMIVWLMLNGRADWDVWVTGIVVSVSVTALMLALTVRLYRRYHSLDIDEITALSRKEEP